MKSFWLPAEGIRASRPTAAGSLTGKAVKTQISCPAPPAYSWWKPAAVSPGLWAAGCPGLYILFGRPRATPCWCWARTRLRARFRIGGSFPLTIVPPNGPAPWSRSTLSSLARLRGRASSFLWNGVRRAAAWSCFPPAMGSTRGMRTTAIFGKSACRPLDGWAAPRAL